MVRYKVCFPTLSQKKCFLLILSFKISAAPRFNNFPFIQLCPTMNGVLFFFYFERAERRVCFSATPCDLTAEGAEGKKTRRRWFTYWRKQEASRDRLSTCEVRGEGGETAGGRPVRGGEWVSFINFLCEAPNRTYRLILSPSGALLRYILRRRNTREWLKVSAHTLWWFVSAALRSYPGDWELHAELRSAVC